MTIIQHRLLKRMWKNLNGVLYPILMEDDAIKTLDALLQARPYTRVKVFFRRGEPMQGWLCVSQSTARAGISRQKGAKKAIAPLERTDIVAITDEKGNAFYSVA